MSTTALTQIQEIIDVEIQKALNEKMTKYIEYIAKRYDISLKLLLNDLENIENLSLTSPRELLEVKDGKCKGITSKGKRCPFSAQPSGYCAKHLYQKPVPRPTIQPRVPTNSIQHNHSFSECLFKVGCPACEKSKRVPSKENLLIDL